MPLAPQPCLQNFASGPLPPCDVLARAGVLEGMCPEPVLEGSAVRRRVAEVAFLEHIPAVCFGDCGGALIPDERRKASRDAIRVHAPNERGHLGVGLPRGALGGVEIRYR